MGMFDFLKGGKKKSAEPTKSPSQVLREAGLDPSTLKFGFGSDGAVTITGTAASDSERQRIASVVAGIPGVSAVNNQIELAAVGNAPESTDSVESSMSTPAAGADGGSGDGSGGGKTYTVVSGDTLWKIATRHYGKGNEYMKIFEANRDILDDPDKIQVGQVLKIPE